MRCDQGRETNGRATFPRAKRTTTSNRGEIWAGRRKRAGKESRKSPKSQAGYRRQPNHPRCQQQPRQALATRLLAGVATG